jgi:hypothetical protein
MQIYFTVSGFAFRQKFKHGIFFEPSLKKKKHDLKAQNCGKHDFLFEFLGVFSSFSRPNIF